MERYFDESTIVAEFQTCLPTVYLLRFKDFFTVVIVRYCRRYYIEERTTLSVQSSSYTKTDQ